MTETKIFGKDSNYGFDDYKNFIINQNMSMHSQSLKKKKIKLFK